MTNSEIIKLLDDNKITLDDVIDAVIDANCIIGVGLITFGEQLEKHVQAHLDKRS